MSLWSRDEHRIVLSPDRVMLVHTTRELTRRGMKRKVQATLDIPCAPATDDGMPWSEPLGALEAALSGSAGRKSSVTVVLSNHFMRYVLLPWTDALDDAREELAYAQHSFNEMYGRDSSMWELRISSGRAGTAQMACAVDTRLLEALRDMCTRLGVDLRSIQPHLMLAYNACRASLQGRSGWLALVEQGHLCLALLQDGKWSWIRTMRIAGHWHQELPFLLDREALVSNIEIDADEVFLWAPEHSEVPIVEAGRWRIRQLQPPAMPGLDGRFAMYMSE